MATVLALTMLVQSADARPWSWLGVRIRDISEQEMDAIASRHGIREGFGVMIVEVMPDTPAARAGMMNGDLVVAFRGRPVTETRVLQRFIASASTEQDTPLTVLRPEGRRSLSVRLVAMPREVAGERVAAEFGFVMRETLPPEPGGARPASTAPAISIVVPGSPAARGGLEVGDVVLQVNDRPVLTRDVAREALAEAALDQPLHVTVRRGERRISATLAAP